MEIFNFNRANKTNISDTHSGFRAWKRIESACMNKLIIDKIVEAKEIKRIVSIPVKEFKPVEAL